MSRIFFIGDMHFYDERIIKFCNRPFKDVNEMNEAIIDNWNRVVKKADTVFVVGDVSFGTKKQTKAIIDRLKGRKILILGNHDRTSQTYYKDLGFKEVYKYPILYKKFFIISHEPIYTKGWTPYLNIHGHIHDNNMIEKYYFNVSVENINYTPISFEEIKKIRGFD